MEELKQLILGPVSVAYYVAAEFFALLAIILSLYIDSRKRDTESTNTPKPFSVTFLIWDNTKRIVVGQICLFLAFRFINEIVGKQLDMWVAVAIGFGLSMGIDQFIAFLKSRSSVKFFDMNREKLAEKISTIVTNQPDPPKTDSGKGV